MTLRSDHVAGAAFAGFGLLIFAFSGDLPFGRLSMPGAGFLPNLLAGLLILFGVLLFLRAAQESAPLVDIDWADLRHAAPVIAITGTAIGLYTQLGFILTMVLMMVGLLALVEQRNIFRAGLYSVVVVLLAFGVFHTFLRAPLPTGPFGF
jgi:tripartite tricarboxylate transporter TctB family protein